MKNKGISLITLIITIIVIIVLAGAVLLNFSKNNPIESAKVAKFSSNLEGFASELTLYNSKQLTDTLGEYDPQKLQADSNSITYDGVKDTSKNITSIITSLKDNSDLSNFQLINGKLTYTGIDASKRMSVAKAGLNVFKVNAPVLANGMTAIKYNETTGTWDTVSNPSTDTSWYDYDNKIWANAKTADGSMWVWIPRYKYYIPEANYHSTNAGTINLRFESGISTTGIGAGHGNDDSAYLTHPAFTFGNTELTGIWVAKFEASGTLDKLAFKTDQIALSSIDINSIFNSCRNMETTNGSQYGWGTSGNGIDTHLMKNTEWGATAYLTNSIYGTNSEIWSNPNSNFLTGQAGTAINSNSMTTTYSYDNLTYGIKASTTGNIYGIYDMSGGVGELVAAYFDFPSDTSRPYYQNIINADNKYKDVYQPSVSGREEDNYATLISKKGDAVYEVSANDVSYWNMFRGWYKEHSDVPENPSNDASFVFFMRGGENIETFGNGIFSSIYANPFSYIYDGFRPCLVVGAGL
jgi:Tfp pilus assembly protein PilE